MLPFFDLLLVALVRRPDVVVPEVEPLVVPLVVP